MKHCTRAVVVFLKRLLFWRLSFSVPPIITDLIAIGRLAMPSKNNVYFCQYYSEIYILVLLSITYT